MIDYKNDVQNVKTGRGRRFNEVSKGRGLALVLFSVLVAICILIAGVLFIPRIWETFTAKASVPTPLVSKMSLNKTVVVPAPAAQAANPTAIVPAPATTTIKWDATFAGLNAIDEYYISVDNNVTGYQTQGAEMSYACVKGFGVFISMDPGSVMGVNTNGLGTVAFVPCSVGKVIKLTTTSWNGSHQNAHMVELQKAIPADLSYQDLLLAYKHDENKPVALIFANDGTYQNMAGPVASVAANPSTSNPTTSTFVWDGKFSSAAPFYIDGDPAVVNFKEEKKPEMSYTCTASFGIYVTMDPGTIQNVSTGDFGAVAYVPCNKGDVVKLSTTFWSTSALHWQIHLVEITDKLPDTVAPRDLLLSLKTADGKPIGYMFSADGKYEVIK